MKRESLLLCGGCFPEDREQELKYEIFAFILSMMEQECPYRMDVTVFGHEPPIPVEPEHLISRAYWQQFETDMDYYHDLLGRAGMVRLVASIRMPDHAERANLVSTMCYSQEVPFQIYLV